jgi:dihydrofolate reductase
VTPLRERRPVQLVVVVPLRLAVAQGAQPIRELLGLRPFVVDEGLLRRRDVRIDDAEIRDHHVTTGFVAIGEDPDLHEAHDVLVGLQGVPLPCQGDEHIGVLGTECHCLRKVRIHERERCHMSKLLYSATMSLDGFIAGVHGDMSWLTDLLVRSSPEVDDLAHDIGALLVGRNTFTGDDPNAGTENEGAFGGQWRGPTVVLTHHPDSRANDPDVVFATDLASAVETAKHAAAGKYVNVLGADVARQCIEAGVLDEILVLVAPILLGDGVRLFEHRGGTRVALELVDPNRTGPLSLWYRVVGGGAHSRGTDLGT